MGILIAFASVCCGVIVLRRQYPTAPRAFRAPLYPWVPALGFVSCVGLTLTLPRITWLYMMTWLFLGSVLFAVIARHKRFVALGAQT